MKLTRASSAGVAESDVGRVDLWVAPVLALASASVAEKLLNEDDCFVLDEITASAARASAMAARILLRVALSHAVNQRIAPSAWHMQPSLNGRPLVAKGLPNVNFSVSHTDRMAVVVTSESLPVGVDVESLPQSISKEMVSTFCCACEEQTLQSMPEEQMSREFVKLWTLKEAYTKMIGLGHSADFSTLGFSFEDVRILHGEKLNGPSCDALFETIVIVNRNQFSHVSIAIGFPMPSTTSAQLHIFELTSGRKTETSRHSPCLVG